MTAVTDAIPWHDSEVGITLSRAKGCLNLYNNLDQGMGSFFFLFVSMNQVAWIFYIFITISSLLGDKMDVSSMMSSMTFCLGTLGLVLWVVSVTLALDRCVLFVCWFVTCHLYSCQRVTSPLSTECHLALTSVKVPKYLSNNAG